MTAPPPRHIPMCTPPNSVQVQDRGAWWPVDQFPVATVRINAVMPKVLSEVASSAALRAGVTGAAFLDTLGGDRVVVTLVYVPGTWWLAHLGRHGK